jgi:hypothetical protein
MATYELTEDFLADEAREAQEVAELVTEADAARRRFDRQLGLLRALPEGWKVVRDDAGSLGRKRGHYFTVYDAGGSQLAQATRERDPREGESYQYVSWGGTRNSSPGQAWAQGIAVMLAAIDAEARLPHDRREVTA